MTTDQLDLFALTARTCADCGATFETSRPATRCAVCRSLRAGELGPCLVHCPVCDAEHRVPVLAATRLCAACRSNLDATRSRVAWELAAALEQWNASGERYEADWAHADAATRERFDRLLAQRGAATFGERLAKAAMLADWGPVLALWERRQVADTAAALVERLRAALVEVDEV